MSNKVNTKSAMNGSKIRLTPKLRFPEFRNAEGWKERLFSDLYSFGPTNILSRDKLNYEFGTVRNIHYGDIHTRFQALFDISREIVPFVNLAESVEDLDSESYCIVGDMVFADASEDLADVGKCIEIVALNDNLVLSGTHTILARRKGAQIVVGFGGHLFRSNRLRVQIQKEAQGSKVFGISAGRLSNVKVCFPANKVEQKKIADCLTSLEDLIAAEARKLDALKAHKKGLMQQLFPREGETQPCLRFPEFQGAGEWEETPLGRLGDLIPGLTYSPDDVREKGLLVLRSSNVQNGEIALEDCVYVDPEIKGANLSCPHDILICVRNGSTNLIGKNALIPDGMPLCTHGAFMTVFRSQASRFVFQLFQTTRYQKQVAGDLGATINSINGGQLIKYKFVVPMSAEQKRISVCLSSVDELIAAQGRKLGQLKVHKKGLMQKLFPAPEEAEA